MSSSPFDPFAGLPTPAPLTPTEQRTALLGEAKRGYAQIRKIFVQRPNTEAVRPSLLAAFVRGRKERALEAFLLLHALQTILDGTPLHLGTWARILSTKKKVEPAEAMKAFQTLETLKLVSIAGSRTVPVITPLREDGSGELWTRPGSDPDEGGLGYFTIPFAYWTSGLADRLTVPGKAMFLITLKETQDPKKPSFPLAYERAQEWYGISERSAERGFSELSRDGLLLTKVVKRPDPRHPLGRREEWWRALASPYATPDRQRLQEAAQKVVESRGAVAPA